jgi:hypothetical protein
MKLWLNLLDSFPESDTASVHMLARAIVQNLVQIASRRSVRDQKIRIGRDGGTFGLTPNEIRHICPAAKDGRPWHSINMEPGKRRTFVFKIRYASICEFLFGFVGVSHTKLVVISRDYDHVPVILSLVLEPADACIRLFFVPTA